MEASHPQPARAADAPSPGELIVQNGRRSGARQPLAVPLTLIGRAPGSDVRLNANGVAPLHCALAHSPGGLVLRSLQAEYPTLVNGEPVTLCTLREGDVLAVGPFRFKVRLPRGDAVSAQLPLGVAALHDLEIVQRERDARRSQAAAVEAAQAALTEEEVKLQRRADELQRREEQLGS